MEHFEKNVFVNCPFDDDYRQLLVSAMFVVKYLGYQPRVALERADSSETRIDKILELIKVSKFGIHDLSRIISVEKGEHYRMNMPFELGIDYGCKRMMGGAWLQKKILILEKERYRMQKALSDLSGSDIKNHNDEPAKIITCIRDWFVTEELHTGPSGNVIWNKFNDFQAYLYDKFVVENGHKSVDDVPIKEVIYHISQWLDANQVEHA